MNKFAYYAFAILLAMVCSPAIAADYYIDAVNGDDTSGDGSEASPWQSLDKVRTVLTGGDNVILASGNYGPFLERSNPCTENVYDDWVTYTAADGAVVEFDNIYITYLGGCSIQDPLQKGIYDVYIRFEGIHILDGVEVNAARHWALVDCLIEKIGPWTGTVTDMHKTAVAFRNGTDILIEGCEITNTGLGITGRGHEVRILNCHIHHGSHDGIRVNGFWDSLIEGNRIHDFDDGVTDEETAGATDPELRWSRHCDLIHIFIPGPGLDGWQNHNVTFRNNILYNPEAQIVQFNNYYASPMRNEQIIFENNIFGPSNANLCNVADPVDGFIFRNNTVVVIPGGVQFNRWLLDNYTLRISYNCTDVEIYNNILGSCSPEAGADLHIFDYNIIQLMPSVLPKGVDGSRAYGRFTQVGVDPLFTNPTAYDGVLDPASPAINFGTEILAPSPIYPTDIVGTLRDLRPDAGAWELPGQSPPAESVPPTYNDHKTIFVDDFEDGHYNDIDPYLQGPNQQGMSWYYPDGVDFKFFVQQYDNLDRNCLHAPTGVLDVQRVAWIMSEQGGDWGDYDFEFDAHNAYQVGGSGAMLLVQDKDNFYAVDIGRDTGILYRVVDGAKTMLGESPDLRLPHSGVKHYKFSIRHDPSGITISADTDDDDIANFTYTDTDSTAQTLFATGRVGFYDDIMTRYYKHKYDNIRVEVLSSIAPGPVNRQIFYNHSAFDGNDAGANAADDNAIATDKAALLPSQTATSVNYTSYNKGINGLIIDIANLPGPVAASDFEFMIGEPGNWAAAPGPTSVTVRSGEGDDGSDRITLTWTDGAIAKTWLQVKVLANANTGIGADDVFYFGNAIGDTCNSAADAIVDASDEINCRNNPRTFMRPAAIDHLCDHNRDGKVNATDEIIARNNVTDFSSALPLITAP